MSLIERDAIIIDDARCHAADDTRASASERCRALCFHALPELPDYLMPFAMPLGAIMPLICYG